MPFKIKFRYRREALSFLNVPFAIISAVVLVIAVAYNLLVHPPATALKFIGIWVVIFSGFGINTLHYVWMRNRFRKHGIKCKGTVVQSDEFKLYSYPSIQRKEKEKYISWVSFYCIVRYTHPETGEEIEFKTPPVTGNPFMHLESPYVTVYVLPKSNSAFAEL